MSEYKLCESCTISVVEGPTSDLMLGHSRKSQTRLCDNCGEQIRYEYLFVRVSPLAVEQMENL